MNDFKLVIILWDRYPQSTINQFYKSLKYFKKLSPFKSKLTILDLTAFSLRSINNNYIHTDNEVEYIRPDNINDLKKIKNNFKNYKKVYGIGPTYSDFKSIIIFLILRWLNLKIIFVNYFGYYLKEKNVIDFNFFYKFNRFFLLKFSYYLSRVLSQMLIFPKIEYYFETSQERINQMKNTFFQKFIKRVKILNSSNSKKIFRINSIYFDEIKIPKNKNFNQDIIVFIDSGFDHPDRLKGEKIKDQIKHDLERKKYFKNLFTFMKFLKESYKKNIVFCQHPKTDYVSHKHFEVIKKNFQVVKGRSEEFLEKGDIIVFTGASSMVNKAIILDKKIIYSLSTSLGLHISDKVLSFIKTIKLPSVNIDELTFVDKKSLDHQLFESKKLYNNFIEKNLISEKNNFSYEQIKKVLYKS